MSDASRKLVQVYFLKPPTGAPWFLAYRKGDFGFTTRAKAERMEKAGVVAPLNLPEPDDEAKQFIPVAELEANAPKLDTIEKVKAHFGEDVNKMRTYCREEGIRVSARVKKAETFYRKIAEHFAG